MYKAGIIGCGFIGVQAPDNHAQAYRECPDTELVALCDKDPHKADCQDYMEMVKIPLDIVSVCTPPETHCQIVCDIAPYVKAIYCEKPIATTLEDADKMIETCHKHNVILQINHQRRFARPKFIFNNRLTTLTHVFDLIRQYDLHDVELSPVDTDESIFDLTLYRKGERMILKGVEHLVDCLKNNHQSISSGEEARKTLNIVLQY